MKTLFISLAIILSYTFQSFASELFIKINMTGDFNVSISNQAQQNISKVYRFFDLPHGNNQLIITRKYNNQFVYSGFIYLQPNERIIAEINKFGQLIIIQKVPINVVNWYTTITNDMFNYPNYPNNPNYPNYNNSDNNINTENFNKFIVIFEKESFDNNKLKMANNYVSNNQLRAEQIVEIAKKFSFDSGRLEFAKYAYDYCIDKGNYFLLKEAFSFSSYYNNLIDYIDNK